MAVGSVFVSYTQADRAWAEWIAWELEDAGLDVTIQAWDSLAGGNFVAFMDRAITACDRMLAVLSPDYLQSEWAMEELYAAVRHKKLVLVRVRDTALEGLLSPRTYVDVFGLDADAARERVIAAVHEQRIKPHTRPGYPGGRGEHEPRYPGRGVRFGIPRQAALFSGRDDELAALEHGFMTSRRPVAIQAIAGLGGVGKTQLAVRYLHEHLADYDVVAWIRCEDGGVTDLASFAAELGVAVRELSAGENALRALTWLNKSELRWLLVLDNIASPEQLDELAPTTGSGRVLVTSRHREFEQFGAMLGLDVFTEEAAEEYLVNRARRPDDRVWARRLAQALGGLPLALAHAGAYCAEGVSFAEYHGLLETLPARELFDRNPDVFYRETIASTWQISIRAAAQRADLAESMLTMAAYLAPERIPIRLFAALVDDSETALQRKRLQDSLVALERFSLANPGPAGLDVHRLLQKVVREDAAIHGNVSCAEHALNALDAAFPESRTPRDWPACESLVTHIRVFTQTAGEIVNPNVLAAVVNRGTLYLLRAGDVDRAMRYAQTACEYAGHRLPPGHPSRLAARANLASAYSLAGRISDATQRYEAVLADTERLYGSLHRETLLARLNLATSYVMAGRAHEAVPMLKELVVRAEAVLGTNDAHTVQARANLASAYDAVGCIADALSVNQAVLADRERLLGPEDPETLRTRSNVAHSYWSVGRIDEAIDLQEALATDMQRILGPHHSDTLGVLGNLASSYESAGRTDEALQLEETVLADSERVLGADHPDTSTARHNLAQTFAKIGRIAEAVALEETALANRERRLGHDHPDSLLARASLARLYRSVGRIAEAIELQEAVVTGREALLGRDHRDTLAARANLADFYFAAQRVADAILVQEEVVRDSPQLLGPEHLDTLTARANLAWAYERAGKTEEAVMRFRAVLGDAHRALGGDHPLSVHIQKTLARLGRATF